MTSITAEYPWATFLEQMVDGLAKQVAAQRRDLAAIDIHGDPAAQVLTAELGDVVPDRRGAVWVTAQVLSLMWLDWLEHHGVDAVIEIGGLRVRVPCEAMAQLGRRSIGRGGWFAEATPSIGPAI